MACLSWPEESPTRKECTKSFEIIIFSCDGLVSSLPKDRRSIEFRVAGAPFSGKSWIYLSQHVCYLPCLGDRGVFGLATIYLSL